MAKVVISNHPIIKDRLTIIRDKSTSSKEFNDNVKVISQILCIEATQDLKLKEVEVETPLCKAMEPRIMEEIFIVPILRAGLGMVDSMRDLLPAARVGIIGLYRDEKTLKPVEYYAKFPKGIENANILLVDPMLATGGSACDAVELLKARGAKRIKFLCIVAAPEGIKKLNEKHPDVEIYAANLDDHLNENGYIVPGLGDCGDRLFGTDL